MKKMETNKTITYTLEQKPINVLGVFEVEPIPTFEELWDRTTVEINGRKLTGAAKKAHLKKQDKELTEYLDALEQMFGPFIRYGE